jgi:hypothetical protein
MGRISRFLTFAVVLALVAGCGKPGHGTIPVHGQITFGGGSWPTKGRLYFTTVKSPTGAASRPGMASFAEDGNFIVTTFRDDDGLLPGEYQVNVECWKFAPKMGSFEKAISYVPAHYQSGMQNGFKVLVPSDSPGPVEVKFDVPKQ